MNKPCEFYKKYELDQITDIEFEAHVKLCNECRLHLQEDKKLLELTGNLKRPVNITDFWDNIESALVKEKSKNKLHYLFTYKNIILRIAAVLIVGLAIGFYFMQQNYIPDKGVITLRMLEKLDEKEEAYQASIDELEAAAQEKMSQMDINLMLLYRDKLEMIDAQIAECKEALANNPANAHIHKYLFAALKEKKETLKEIYKIKTDNLKEDS